MQTSILDQLVWINIILIHRFGLQHKGSLHCLVQKHDIILSLRHLQRKMKPWGEKPQIRLRKVGLLVHVCPCHNDLDSSIIMVFCCKMCKHISSLNVVQFDLGKFPPIKAIFTDRIVMMSLSYRNVHGKYQDSLKNENIARVLFDIWLISDKVLKLHVHVYYISLTLKLSPLYFLSFEFQYTLLWFFYIKTTTFLQILKVTNRLVKVNGCNNFVLLL